MSRSGRPRGAWLVAAVAALLVAGTLGCLAAGVVDLPLSLDALYPNAVFGLTLPALGAVVLARAPGHAVGRLLLYGGFACGLTLAAYAYAQYGLVDSPGGLPLALAAGWLSSWIWAAGVPVVLALTLLLYPDGRLPGRRWWPALAVAVAGPVLLALSSALRPGELGNHPVRDNPLGLPFPPVLFDAVGAAGLGLFLLALLSGVLALGTRWRRAPAQDRAAIGWLLAAAVPLLLVAAAPTDGVAAVAARLVAVLAVPLLPFAVAVGVLRHRLYGVEVVVRRSLVWWWMTTALLAVYAGTAASLDAALRGRASAGVALAATGMVAVLSVPLRDRAQRAADRLLFGERGDPYPALVRLGRRVGDAAGPSEVLDEVARTVAETLRAPFAAVLLPGDAPDHPAASHGTRSPHRHEVPLVVHGEPVGRLEVGLRAGEGGYGRRDARLLADLGPQVAAAAHAALLRRDLEASRERLARSLEEERRRVRRDLHDGLGPALTGVAFTAAAARNTLVDDPHQAGELLDQVTADARACIEEVRRIAHDLRPPALDELGLPGALEAYAARVLSDGGPAVRVSASALPALPAAVEVAAYRIGVEAVTNVVRHARARLCRLSLEVRDGDSGPVLQICVEDDGVGLPAQRRPGVGMTAMSERTAELGGRFSAGSAPGGGTRVHATLPLVHA